MISKTDRRPEPVTSHRNGDERGAKGKRAIQTLQQELMLARELARDASHDIRNALNIQKMALHALTVQMQRLPPAEIGAMRESVNDAKEQSEYIGNLVHELGEFSRGDADSRPTTRVQGSVAQALAILGKHAPKNCEIRTRVRRGQRFPIAPIKLLRVLVNLLQNAIHSLHQKEFSEACPRLWIESGQTKKQAWLRVRDNGTGIPLENLGKVFEPSFTTKTTGLGLGLNICRKVVEEAGGQITARSVPEEFAEFTLSFPVRSEKG